ncbi:unnamed protein product [Rhizophagus irregularis]|nr:unnamed protein product [Rhizophagus irregularis]
MGRCKKLIPHPKKEMIYAKINTVRPKQDIFLTNNEKLMIINVYNYFLGANSKKEDHQKVTLRKHVAEVLGIGECTVGQVMSDWKSRSDNTFTPHKTLKLQVQKSKKLLIAWDFTPSYHCELQPIEGVWSVVKGEVACSDPHPNLLSVRNTLLKAFKEKISSKVIVGLLKRVLKNAKEYFESDENIQFTVDEFDAYSRSNNDHVI